MNPGRVLVTGGTRGVGLAIAREVTRAGGRVVVTHRWGSVAPEELAADFARDGLPAPRVEACDAADAGETEDLVRRLDREWGGLDGVVSGVAFAARSEALALRPETLGIALGYSAWPLLHLARSVAASPTPPRRLLAVSSAGVDRALPGYAQVGVAKAALEGLARYLAAELGPRGVAVNVLRLGHVDTPSLEAVLPGAADRARASGALLSPEEAGRAGLALLSGLLDAAHGQVFVVDRGAALRPPAGT